MPCLLVGLDELCEIPRRRAVDLVQRIVHEPRDLEKADTAVEKRRDRNLVRSVERARVRSAALTGRARQRQQRKTLEIRRLELEPKAQPRSRAPAPTSSCAPGA